MKKTTAAFLLTFYILKISANAKECNSSLGGSIPDSDFTASSSTSGHSAKQARLNNSGWKPAKNSYIGEWLQVKFPNLTNVTAIEIQKLDKNADFKYSVYHSTDGTYFQSSQVGEWVEASSVLGSDSFAVKKTFTEPVIARYLRFYPLLDIGITCNMELYGCAAESTEAEERIECSSALGMQDRSIPNSALTASNARGGVPAKKARLNSSGGWRTTGQGAWIQVDLTNLTNITAIATQGHSSRDEWVKSYTMQHSIDGRNFQSGQKLTGNRDKNTIVKNTLDQPIIARFLRIYPDDYRKGVGLRLELYGCPIECASSLGLKDHSILANSDFTTSSSKPGYQAKQARLNSGKGWVPEKKSGAWLQVKFARVTKVKAMATRGCSTYSVYHSTDGIYFQPSRETFKTRA